MPDGTHRNRQGQATCFQPSRFGRDHVVLRGGRSVRVATWPGSLGRRFEGKAAVREGLGARFAGIPDVHYGDDAHFVAGDPGASEWTLTGTTVEGETLEVRGCDPWTFRDGLISRKDSYSKIRG